MTNACSNCGTEFPVSTVDSLVLVHRREDPAESDKPALICVAAFCSECLDGTKTIKLVLKRNIAGQFAYEQFSVLEMRNRAFGTAE